MQVGWETGVQEGRVEGLPLEASARQVVADSAVADSVVADSTVADSAVVGIVVVVVPAAAAVLHMQVQGRIILPSGYIVLSSGYTVLSSGHKTGYTVGSTGVDPRVDPC